MTSLILSIFGPVRTSPGRRLSSRANDARPASGGRGAEGDAWLRRAEPGVPDGAAPPGGRSGAGDDARGHLADRRRRAHHLREPSAGAASRIHRGRDGRSFRLRVHRSDRWPQAQRRLRLRQQGVAERVEFELVRKDGSRVWPPGSANAVFDREGRYAGGLAVFGDLSEQKQREHRCAHRSRSCRRARRPHGRLSTSACAPAADASRRLTASHFGRPSCWGCSAQSSRRSPSPPSARWLPAFRTTKQEET